MAVIIDDFHDHTIGSDVHSTGGALMSNETTIAATIAVGDGAGEGLADALSPVIPQILSGHKDSDVRVGGILCQNCLKTEWFEDIGSAFLSESRIPKLWFFRGVVGIRNSP